MELSDEILVKKTLEGDDSAFRILINRHCGVVHGIREFIYAPGIGLVKSTFIRRNGAVGTAQLTHYEILDRNGDYFPLALGNKWAYEWLDKDGVLPTTDVYEVLGEKKGKYNLSHYFLALKLGKVLKIDPDEEHKTH